MSRDQMQDVFPIVFQFVKGEQPTAEKLTGLVKHTDAAFSELNQAIGDPWDYSLHTDAGSAPYALSPDKLGINSLSRVIGPSDYLSPMGGCWNEKTGQSVVIRLDQYKNSWSIGFPLVKLKTGQKITPTTAYSTSLLEPLVWPTDITITGDTDGALATKVSSISLVVSPGDFYVDSYRGVITSYKSSGGYTISLTIGADKLNMFGPGVPWGTHNVIPTWKETTALCSLVFNGVIDLQDSWILTLPSVAKNSRSASTLQIQSPVPNEADINEGSDALWYSPSYPTTMGIFGLSSDYELPQSISSITTGTVLPEGFCQLWDDTAGRFIPLVEFRTLGTSNTLLLVTPSGWLSASTNRYRLVVVGTSIAENLSYLNMVVRSGHHSGIVNAPSITYLSPISHNNLSNRFSGSIYVSSATDYRYRFRESSMEVNPHPQYLHRFGYNANDLSGNSANAMRGDLVFTGSTSTLALASSTSVTTASYGILFGGGDTAATTGNAMIRLEGLGETWSSGIAKNFPFGLGEAGSRSYVYSEPRGALTVSSWLGTPLYLRGHSTSLTYLNYDGACLGFDLGRTSEYNYIKLFPAIRTVGAGIDFRNMAANTGQTDTSVLGITPSLATSITGADCARLSPKQIREFRFRGGAYVSTRTNPDDSLGGTNVRGAGSEITEYQTYFTSPSIVGTDWLGLYSNAIFFSDTGDGQKTSFGTYGEAWLNGTVDAFGDVLTPSGMYYIPKGILADEPYVSFYMRDQEYVGTDQSALSDQCLSFGDRHGFWYQGTGNSGIQTLGTLLTVGSDGYYAFAGPTPTSTPAATYLASILSATVYIAANYSFVLANNTPNKGMLFQTWASNSDMGLSTLSANSNIALGTASATSLITLTTAGSESDLNITTSGADADMSISTTGAGSDMFISTTGVDSNLSIGTTSTLSDVMIATIGNTADISILTTGTTSHLYLTTTSASSNLILNAIHVDSDIIFLNLPSSGSLSGYRILLIKNDDHSLAYYTGSTW